MKKAFIQLHIAVLLAGFTAILGKLIDLNEAWLVWWRLLLSILCLWAIVFFRKEIVKISLKDTFKLLGVGGIIAMHWVFFYGSIKYSNVSVGVTCLSAIGFFTSILEPLIRRRRIDLIEVLLGLLAILGIYLIFDFYPDFKLGIIFGIISALLASLFPIFNKTIINRFSSNIVTTYELTGGFLVLSCLIPIYLTFFPATYFIPTTSDLFWLIILAVFCTVFAFILSLHSLKHLSAFTTNLSYNFEPIYSIIMAFIIFKENKFLGSGFYYGFFLILLAVSFQMIRVYRDRSKEKKLALRKM
ncbi:MAG: DMT family transporter [Ginsengibacter sp.]